MGAKTVSCQNFQQPICEEKKTHNMTTSIKKDELESLDLLTMFPEPNSKSHLEPNSTYRGDEAPILFKYVSFKSKVKLIALPPMDNAEKFARSLLPHMKSVSSVNELRFYGWNASEMEPLITRFKDTCKKITVTIQSWRMGLSNNVSSIFQLFKNTAVKEIVVDTGSIYPFYSDIFEDLTKIHSLNKVTIYYDPKIRDPSRIQGYIDCAKTLHQKLTDMGINVNFTEDVMEKIAEIPGKNETDDNDTDDSDTPPTSPTLWAELKDTEDLAGFIFEGAIADFIPSTSECHYSDYLDELQKATLQGEGIRVAVLDTGCDIFNRHIPTQQIKGVKSFVEGHAFIDYHGHGTHCVGILAQLAKQAEIFVGKIADNEGKITKEDYFVDGLEWAIETVKADVISLSLGMAKYSDRIFEQIQTAITKGIHVVCAAANSGYKTASPISYPARYGNTICVGAHGKVGERCSFSAIGREIDLLAPGDGIVSAGWNQKGDLESGGFRSRVVKSGTSMACPWVAGLIALILKYAKKQGYYVHSCQQMKDILRRLCTSYGHHSQKRGYGLIDPDHLTDLMQLNVIFRKTLKKPE